MRRTCLWREKLIDIPTLWFKNHNTLGCNIGLYTVYLAKDKRGKKIDSKST